MPRLHHHLLVSGLSCFALIAAALSSEDRGSKAVPPEAREAKSAPAGEAERQTKEAVDAIVKVLDRDNMLLSADEASVSPEFTMEVRLSVPKKDGEHLVTDLRIARRGERVAVVVQSADGLPYCFLTNGLVVVFDREKPGALRVHEGGSPVFILEGKEGLMDFTLSHREGPHATVRFDPESLLRAMLTKLRAATYDEASGAVMLRTDKSRVLLSFPVKPREDAPSLDRLAVLGSAGTSIMVTDISTDAQRWPRLYDIGKESVDGLGLRTRELTAKEARQLIPLVPGDFATRKAERQSAEKLKVLLESGPPDC